MIKPDEKILDYYDKILLGKCKFENPIETIKKGKNVIDPIEKTIRTKIGDKDMELFGCVVAVHDALKAGVFPHLKVRRRYLIHKSDLLRYINRNIHRKTNG